MFTRHRCLRRPPPRTQPAPAVPVRPAAAPAVTSALALPSLDGIPTTFTSRDTSGAGALKACAMALADAGILRPEHIGQLRQPKPNQTLAKVFKAETEPVAKQLIEIALAELGRLHRPKPFVKLAVMLASDASLFNQEGWDGLHCDEAKGGILISCDCQNPIHLEIGPNLQRIEDLHPGLGQTVLYWLSEGLNTTVRALDPRTAVHWASNNYWQGESDESFYVEEQMDDLEHYHNEQQKELPEDKRTPFNRAAALKEVGGFTRAELDKALPAICNGKPKLSRAALLRLRAKPKTPSTIRHVIDATLAVIACDPEDAPELLYLGKKNDLADLEFTSWYVCPYLLRWSRPAKGNWEKIQDPLGMFWDDYLNNEFQAGETNLTANSAFLWRQDETGGIVAAFRRFAVWCRILQAAENLLTAIHPREIVM